LIPELEYSITTVRGGSVKLATGTSSENKSIYPDRTKTNQDPSLEGRRSSKNKFSPQSGRPGFVQRLDRNGDGKVSRAEFDGPKDRFAHHDKNNDDYISESEAPKGPPPGGNRHQDLIKQRL